MAIGYNSEIFELESAQLRNQMKVAVDRLCDDEVKYWYNSTDISFSYSWDEELDSLQSEYYEFSLAWFELIDKHTVVVCRNLGVSDIKCSTTNGNLLEINSREEAEDYPKLRDKLGATNDSVLYFYHLDDAIDSSELIAEQCILKFTPIDVRFPYSESADKSK